MTLEPANGPQHLTFFPGWKSFSLSFGPSLKPAVAQLLIPVVSPLAECAANPEDGRILKQTSEVMDGDHA